jgi:hypothetical protein
MLITIEWRLPARMDHAAAGLTPPDDTAIDFRNWELARR